MDIELLPGGSAYALWIEVDQDRAQFRVRQVEALREEVRTNQRCRDRERTNQRLSTGPAFANNELIFAWTARLGTLRVMTAAAKPN